MKILVIEDDEGIAQVLSVILASQNYAVEVAADGQAGWALLEAFDYDLVLLDVMLPKLDGVTLCRQIRARGLHMPVLLLTGCDSSHDKAIGLDAGADDYVVKPFDPEELVARVRALLRRGATMAQPVLEWGDLRLDPSSCEVTFGTQPLLLTPKEYALLELFLRNGRRVFSCGMILEHLWSYEEMPGEDAVRTHIKGLRQKLKVAGLPADLVETVYGIGYRLKPREADGPPAIAPAKSKAKSANKPAKRAETVDPRPGLAPAANRDAAQDTGVPTALSQMHEPAQNQLQAGMNQIWQRFQGRVCEQVAVLEQAVSALEQKALAPDLRQQATQESHTLAGSLGTFGLPEGSRLARQIEVALQGQPPPAGSSLRQDAVADLRAWVMALRQEVEHSQSRLPQAELLSGVLPLSSLSEADCPLLLIVDSDRRLTEQLTVEAATWGFAVEVAASLTRARDQIFAEPPDIVLLDPAISPNTAESLSLLTELSQQVPPIPVIIFTAHSNLAERLDVARLGGRSFLQKSTALAKVLETVDHVLHRAEQAKAKVMVVDDDPILLAIVRSLLEPWGLNVTTLANPLQFWEVLEATAPDLLILDIEMPQIGGLELCQIVRNDSRWSGLPVLFLTSHTDAAIVNQVFAVGADDFVNKPIVGPELVTRIINRLERIRFLRNLAETDPLTKLANRQKSVQDLNTFLHLAERQNQCFCLAVLDLDHFKQVNDHHGHAAGDEVLSYVGQLLRRSFRAEDVLARWGGEEFVIALYGMTKQEGVQRLAKLLKSLRQYTFTAPTATVSARKPPMAAAADPALAGQSSGDQASHQFQITLSAGVAQYPEDGADLHTLYQAADTALYQAKSAGRDRIVAIEPANVEGIASTATHAAVTKPQGNHSEFLRRRS